jgi:hypothetical protein
MSKMPNKDQVAQELIEAHFDVEPHLVEVWRIVGDSEGSPTEPIKLIEVNHATVSTGSITPFAFAPTYDVPFPTVVAEVTPDEFEQARRDPKRLPIGWRLANARQFKRSA